ncbi:MAG: hypothetical protein LC799_14160, partial [Actinobacteria bacterium]|nr:hypothetical protein [Actinomycetota bacterium]
RSWPAPRTGSSMMWSGRPVSDRGAGPELTEWIALRRVRRGGVAKVADCYLDHGRPMPSYLAGPLDDLTRAGLLALSDADPATGGLRRIAVTDTGHAQYGALCRVHNR